MAKAMTVRIDDNQAEQLEAIAQAEGVSISQAVREAIAALVEARRKDVAFQERLRASVERNQRILERLAQ
ncbi:MAG: ribbon-helix-helix domain-containing protein [Actinobacteria bacterium]|nr:ribbon-helix-helix domain-containing protein [Actinomycetota bacterium]